MPRTLILIRHANAEYDNPDHERNLSETGKREASAIAQKLKRHNLSPDLLITSTAQRTRQTSRIISEIIGLPSGNIKEDERLYTSDFKEMMEVIQGVPDTVQTLIVVGHNPQISALASFLNRGAQPLGLPTCGTVGISLDTDRWSGDRLQPGKQLFYETPDH